MRVVTPESLTQDAFAPFGDVVEAGHDLTKINDGYTLCAGDIAALNLVEQGGQPRVSLYTTQPMQDVVTVRMMERHPLNSQLFFPLSDNPFLVVVAAPGDLNPTMIRVFVTSAGQGVNYHAGVWHHFSLALVADSRFLVVDRKGPGTQTEEVELSPEDQFIIAV